MSVGSSAAMRQFVRQSGTLEKFECEIQEEDGLLYIAVVYVVFLTMSTRAGVMEE